jgi:hypothetical protein
MFIPHETTDVSRALQDVQVPHVPRQCRAKDGEKAPDPENVRLVKAEFELLPNCPSLALAANADQDTLREIQFRSSWGTDAPWYTS